jgi:hypothetical protein
LRVGGGDAKSKGHARDRDPGNASRSLAAPVISSVTMLAHRAAWLRHAAIAHSRQPARPGVLPAPPAPRPAWWRLLGAAALIAAWSYLLRLEVLERVAPREAFPLAVALAGALALILARPTRLLPLPHRDWRRRLALFAAVFAVGVIARALFLRSFPPLDGNLWEECQTGTVAEGSLLTGGLDQFFPITNLLAEAGFRLIGKTMLGLRLPFVLLSIASIPLFHAAARSLLRTYPAAVAATALFASSAYLGAAGRVALESMAPIATLCAALWATFHACRVRSLAAFALAGLSYGLLLLEYTSYKLYPPLLLATLTIAALANPPERPGLHRTPPLGATLWHYRWHFAALALAATAVVIPVFAQNPHESVQILVEGITRNRTALLEAGHAGGGWAGMLGAAGRVVTAFRQVFLGAGSTDLLPPTAGIVDPVTGVIGLFGLAWCAATAKRDARRLFLAVAAVVTVVLAGLLVDIPTRYRITPLAPIYFLAVAVPLDDFLTARPRAHEARLWITACFAAVAAYNLHYLFNVARHDPYVLAEFGDPRLALAREIAAAQRLHPGEPVYVASECQVFDTTNDYSWLYDLKGVRMIDDRQELVAAAGTVVADGDFIAEVRALPNARLCREKRRQLGNRPLHWIRCRLEATSPRERPETSSSVAAPRRH